MTRYLTRSIDLVSSKGKSQKHQNFDAELQANQGRIDAVAKTGNDLVESGHYAADNIKARVDEIQDKWNEVNDMSKGKGRRGKNV